MSPSNIVKNFDKIKNIIVNNNNNINIINFAVTLPSFLKAGTLIFKQKVKVDLFFKNINSLFKLLRNEGYKGLGLNEFS